MARHHGEHGRHRCLREHSTSLTAFKASPLPSCWTQVKPSPGPFRCQRRWVRTRRNSKGSGLPLPAVGTPTKQNSIATGSVMVESKLKLNWEYATFDLRDAENNTAELPLTDGEAYTLTIGLTSQETGSANYTCQDSSNTVLSSMEVDIVNRGDRASLSCTFAATASMTTVRLIPEDASISSTLSRSFGNTGHQRRRRRCRLVVRNRNGGAVRSHRRCAHRRPGRCHRAYTGAARRRSSEIFSNVLHATGNWKARRTAAHTVRSTSRKRATNSTRVDACG